MAGFPTQAYFTAGTYQGGPFSMFVSLGNIDSNSDLEIVASATSTGPLWAYKADGSLISGWPDAYGTGTGYPAIGNVLTGTARQVVTGYGPFQQSCNSDRYVYSGNGQPVSGWPVSTCWGGTTQPPMLVDMNGDGHDEVFFGLDAYDFTGQRLPNWPAATRIGVAIAAGDLDHDGRPDYVVNYGDSVDAFHFDHSHVAGFPFSKAILGYTSKLLTLGDVDGDGSIEIIQPGRQSVYPGYGYIQVYSSQGVLKWTRYSTGTVDYDSAPALADLDGNGIPEIVFQSNGALDVWRGDGTELSGFPVTWGVVPGIQNATDSMQGNSSPVVGDIDGDGLPDIVVVSVRNDADGIAARVRAFSRNGQLLAGFPKDLPVGTSMVPAIGDLSNTGHNDVVIASTAWDGHEGMKNFIWAFDLGGKNYGPIEWGQMGGDAKHRGVYPVPRNY